MSGRQNPYQPGTYGASPFGGGGFTLQPNYGYTQQPFYPSMMAYGGGLQKNGTLIYPDTVQIVSVTCYRCRMTGHYANECPYGR